MSLLTRLILLNPGTIQTHPEMGVGLVQRYRYSTEGSEIQLQSDIRLQIDKYLPQFQGASVVVKFKDHAFQILIRIDNLAFAILYDIESNTIEEKFTKLEDL